MSNTSALPRLQVTPSKASPLLPKWLQNVSDAWPGDRKEKGLGRLVPKSHMIWGLLLHSSRFQYFSMVHEHILHILDFHLVPKGSKSVLFGEVPGAPGAHGLETFPEAVDRGFFRPRSDMNEDSASSKTPSSCLALRISGKHGGTEEI